MRYRAEFMEQHGVVLLDERPDLVRVGVASEPTRELRRLLQSCHCRQVAFTRLARDELVIRIQRAAAAPATAPTDAEAPLEGVGIVHAHENAPAVNLVNSLLNDAVRHSASDIHIGPYGRRVRVRYRIDGLLRDAETLTEPADAAQRPSGQQERSDDLGRPVRLVRGDEIASVAARLKVLAGLNAAERRRPQDGRFTARVRSDSFDVRFSSVPTISGESLVLRLFRRTGEAYRLDELGMPDPILDHVTRTVERRAGFIIICGPTGSGKTTTLHAALRHINVGTRKIVTIEDPVEYRLHGIEQVQTNEAAGLTFESILRRVLRQDPNVIMVGEIRDAETARLSVRAALTGHLVLATLHSRSAATVRDRLIDLGVTPALLDSLAPTILAQRLVRRICNDCAGHGCSRCYESGFRGRTGLFELATPERRSPPLHEDGRAKVAGGITTEKEVTWATSI